MRLCVMLVYGGSVCRVGVCGSVCRVGVCGFVVWGGGGIVCVWVWVCIYVFCALSTSNESVFHQI